MAAISSIGIGSGVLTSALIDKLVNADKAPTDKRLTQQTDDINAKLSAFGKIQSAITDLRLPARSLADPAVFNSLSAASTNTAVSASVGSGAKTGVYSVEVSALAKSDSLTSAQFGNSNLTTLGTGTLTISSGSNSAVITIDNTNNTLDGLASAINNQSGLGVNASVLNTGSGYKLVLTSANSGLSNAINVSVVDSDGNNTDTAGLSQLSYTSGANNLTQTQAAADAALKVNGVAITRSSNSISDAINGLTLNLSATNVGAPATVTVSQDTSTVLQYVKDFITKYNAFQKTVSDNTKFDPNNKANNGLLLGDASTRTIITQVKNILGSSIAGLGTSNDRSLSDVGITTDYNTGNLVLNESTFLSQLSANPKDVAAIFSTQGRVTDSQINYVASSVNTKAGTYGVNVTTLATRAAITGTVALGSSTTIDANNNSLTVKIDGVTSGALTLTAGSYTPTQLATEIQTQINKDSTLSAAGKTATVTVDSSNKLIITSDQFGSASGAEITAVGVNSTAQLGLSVGVGAAGVDVAGTINGVAATGSGQRLTGATGNAADGIAIDITGGSLGSRGTVTYIQGIGQQFVDLITGFLGTGGAVTTKNNTLNTELANVSKDRAALNTRLDSLRARLVKQFTAADIIVSKLKSTQAFLTAQFAPTTKTGG